MIEFIKHISDELILGIWNIDESLEELKSSLPEEELTPIENFHPKKQTEYITSRLLIKEMCSEIDIPYKGLYKDEHGKPFFKDSIHHMSISHSYPWVAGLIHLSKPCGIDVEKPKDQMLRIKKKYLNPKEMEDCQDKIEQLGLYWSAKEAIYKIHGRKKLSLASNIIIKSFDDTTIRAAVKVNDKLKPIDLLYEQLDGYYIVYGYGSL